MGVKNAYPRMRVLLCARGKCLGCMVKCMFVRVRVVTVVVAVAWLCRWSSGCVSECEAIAVESSFNSFSYIPFSFFISSFLYFFQTISILHLLLFSTFLFISAVLTEM